MTCSIRNRFILGISILLLPLLLLSSVGYFYFKQSLTTLHTSISQVLENSLPINQLQDDIQKIHLQMANRSLSKIETPKIIHQTKSIDQHLLTFLHRYPEGSELYEMYQSALHEWQLTQHAIYTQLQRSTVKHNNASISDNYLSPLLNTLYLLNNIENQQQQRISQYYQSSETLHITVQMLIAAIFIFGLITTISISIVLTRSILIPLKQFDQWAIHFAQTKQPETIHIKSYIEFERLANTFNTMANALQEKQEKLEKLSLRDELTDLYNRRSLQLRLEEEFIRFERYQQRFALMIVDIDHFTSINDSYGRVAGDQALVEIAQLLKAQIRPIDYIARYDSEKFALLLPEINLQGAQALAERIRVHISDTTFHLDNHQIGITVSIGYALLGENVESINALLTQADKALILAKEKGRNKTCYIE